MRYCLTKVIASPDPDEPGWTNEIHAAGIGGRATMPLDPKEGDTCLVIVGSADFVRVRELPNTDLLPHMTLDDAVNSINQNARKAMEEAFARHGIALSKIGNSDGYRELINSVGRGINPHFDADRFG